MILEPDTKNPSLRNQAHCQVARKAYRTSQNLSISLPALPHKDKKRKAQLLTKNIRHLADSAKNEAISNK